ncbi:MAG: MarR family transcriptional regulator [Brachybacterium sp.]|nr:MarR family transcriptional regulator [Brachybacterium sp.]
MTSDREELLHDVAQDLRRALLVSSRLLRQRTASEDVTASQYSVLAYLQREGDAPPGRLAAFERVSPPVMTRMIGRLEETGHVRRRAHPEDGRQVLVSLTARGEAVVVTAREEREQWLRERLESLDEERLERLREATDVLWEVLVAEPAGAADRAPADGSAGVVGSAEADNGPTAARP